MAKAEKPDPYSRSYWRFADEFPDIYADDHAYALWSRLRDIADMAWPSSATLPLGTRKAALDMLVAVELVYLMPGRRYRIRGMDKQRTQRQEAASKAAQERWRRQRGLSSDDDAPAMRPHSARNARAMHIPSRAEPRLDEPTHSHAPALPEHRQAELLDQLKESMASKGLLPVTSPNGAELIKRQPSDEERIEQLQAILTDQAAPEWKHEAARTQLELMGVKP